MTVRAAEITSERPVSGFRIIFDLARERLKSSKLLYYWEIIAWSFFAAHLGADIFGFYDASVDLSIVTYCLWTIVILTPLLIFIWVYRVHVFRIPSDETIRTIPIPPSTILFARMMAVWLMWLSVFLPLIVIAVHFYNISSGVFPAIDRWRGVAVGFLVLSDRINPRYCYLNAEFAFFFWFLQMLGWVILPMTWGFFVGTVFKEKSFLFYVLLILYILVIPAFWYVVFGIIFGPFEFSSLGHGWAPFINSEDLKAQINMAIPIGTAWILPAYLLYKGAYRFMGRRRR